MCVKLAWSPRFHAPQTEECRVSLLGVLLRASSRPSHRCTGLCHFLSCPCACCPAWWSQGLAAEVSDSNPGICSNPCDVGDGSLGFCSRKANACLVVKQETPGQGSPWWQAALQIVPVFRHNDLTRITSCTKGRRLQSVLGGWGLVSPAKKLLARSHRPSSVSRTLRAGRCSRSRP